MKKAFSFALSILLSASFLHAEIFESSDTRDILPYITQKTLVVFDLDDTVFHMPSMLGNDAWFQHHVQQELNKGGTYDEATQTVLTTYLLLQYLSELELIDENTAELIADLQKQETFVMALTSRNPALCEHTKKELQRLGIYFSITCPCNQDLDLGITHRARHSEGIIFGANNQKGELLLQFFEIIGYWPEKIIFLNDKRSHLLQVSTKVEPLGIEFIGLRYSKEDERKKEFDPEIAAELLYDFKMKRGLVPLKKEKRYEDGNNGKTAAKH